MSLTYTLIHREQGTVTELFGPTTLTEAQDHFLREIRSTVPEREWVDYIVRPNFTNPALRDPRDWPVT